MTTPLQVTTARLRIPVTERDHVRGPVDAPVTVVEYGDFQCRFCGAAYPNLAEVLRQRADMVRLVYRHFPITNVHPYAETAAETAEAAAARGRFWEMYDWLYQHQDQLDQVHLSLGVEQIGLSPEEIAAEVGRQEYADRVRQDFVGGIRSGVNGTPTLFVNDVRHDGGYDLAELLAVVDAATDDG
ncbi:thioredoxin domain-containing protein [Micromonospora aurantiaca]|uniref:DsbA family protein n=1 Tax=Micromonospora aurantiaca (nom. illeg.) TaxID=47850 RepID=A0A1C6TL16_9ACTN|nr:MULTISPECIES: thioredoxin domain-containing protein [Micromonospora]ADU09081.1 DSBA oxidoreductase [Micromonospora sp. L5]AXH94277.1 DsbA family protein [Micromonospora aurantiaca]KAB1108091.1 thioredoxin domain-containing protein [Micromonospora aurantiaca]MBC9003116.1 thioredoxin domain-containing protein [Micromonospora aurantiaca]MDG4753526.1 thioredoxin domain-containing protein [Micromonospora sp. WMMD718]